MPILFSQFFFFNHPATTEIYTLSLHDALPIFWGQKGNYFEVPTDCPQRDERMGWTGDAQAFIPTAAYNFDIALRDRKSTRLNSSHQIISYAVFCLKKKKKK